MGNSNTKPLAYTSLLRPILEYWAACWNSYREGKIKALDRVRKKVTKFANHTSETEGHVWKAIWDKLQGSCYLSRDDHDRKIRARKQRTNIGKIFLGKHEHQTLELTTCRGASEFLLYI
jgi:hypothetical protein